MNLVQCCMDGEAVYKDSLGRTIKGDLDYVVQAAMVDKLVELSESRQLSVADWDLLLARIHRSIGTAGGSDDGPGRDPGHREASKPPGLP